MRPGGPHGTGQTIKQTGRQGAGTGSLDGAVGLEIRTDSSAEGISLLHLYSEHQRKITAD